MNKSILVSLMAFVSTFLVNTASLALDKDSPEKVEVKGYMRKDGTKVEGSIRSKGAKAETVKVKAYTKKDGTVVERYTRKKPIK